MIKHKLLSTILFILLISYFGYSQDTINRSFKLRGKPILKVYTNFHTGISENADKAGFEIKRAYFGYSYELSRNFQVALKLDIGSPNDASEYSLLRRFAYFKNAYIRYNWNNLSTQFGIIDVYLFSMQEIYWAHRYISKSFMDEYRFGPKADLGWTISYSFNKYLLADFGIYNGEGYTKLQDDNAFKGGFGISVFPVKGLVVRLYGDAIKKGVYQNTVAAFVGYKYKDKFIGGLEYNQQFNFNYIEGQDKYGYSLYGSYYLLPKWQVFARFDQVYSNIPAGNDQPWDLEMDGSSLTGGIEYSPIRHVKIALNYQDWAPYARNMGNEAFVFLNFEFRL